MRVFWVVVLCGLLAGCGTKAGSTEPSQAGKNSDSKKVKWTREEFRAAVVGKTQDDVIKAVGKPSRTSDLGGVLSFSYDEVSTDTTTGKNDPSAIVIFENGIANRVIY